MATLGRTELIAALTRLGELADQAGKPVELLLMGGGLMVLLFQTRPATRDLDVVIISPTDAAQVRSLAKTVGEERGWPEDWLNDAVKGFLVGTSNGPVIFSATGIVVRRPAIEQLLAMKLSAWRDDVDIADARRLLEELSGAHDFLWNAVAPYVQPGKELKAKYAFDDLWDEAHGSH
jgi:hypothetical protein